MGDGSEGPRAAWGLQGEQSMTVQARCHSGQEEPVEGLRQDL